MPLVVQSAERGRHELEQSERRAGRTIVVVTHEPEIAARAHRTVHLRDGRVERISENGLGSAPTPGKGPIRTC